MAKVRKLDFEILDHHCFIQHGLDFKSPAFMFRYHGRHQRDTTAKALFVMFCYYGLVIQIICP